MNVFKRILATIDIHDEVSSEKVVNAALELMSGDDILFVVCVVPDFGMSVVSGFFPKDYEQDMLEKTRVELHAFTEKHVPDGTPVQHIIAHGSIYEEILAAANEVNADMIVVGSHRPALKDYLLGPNAARVVRHATQSVLVVRYN
ncbi:MAG: universal stress protein [Pseudomonadota bacterium]